MVGEAGDGRDAVALTRELRPDVVIMDIRMPGTDGLAATAEIRADPDLRATRVLMSPFTVRAHVHRAMTKLEARDRAQLVVIAYQTGLVTGTESPAWTGS